MISILQHLHHSFRYLVFFLLCTSVAVPIVILIHTETMDITYSLGNVKTFL